MRVLLINNDGGGFADQIEIQEGMSLGQLFKRQCPDAKPGDYLIRVNRQPATNEQVLTEGDRISITPRKIEGAS